MALKKPALEAQAVEAVSKCGYPEPHYSKVMPREKRRLGDAFGLTRIGVNRTTLLPGKISALRHWHTAEDEFVWVIEGEVVLVSNRGEEMLRAGDCAGFRAGVADGHHFQNRSDREAVLVEIGSRRAAEDTCYYPDNGVIVEPGRKVRHFAADT